MPFPSRQDIPSLLDNRSAASVRLKHLQKRFSRDPNNYVEFSETLNGLLQSVYVEPVNEVNINSSVYNTINNEKYVDDNSDAPDNAITLTLIRDAYMPKSKIGSNISEKHLVQTNGHMFQRINAQ